MPRGETSLRQLFATAKGTIFRRSTLNAARSAADEKRHRCMCCGSFCNAGLRFGDRVGRRNPTGGSSDCDLVARQKAAVLLAKSDPGVMWGLLISFRTEGLQIGTAAVPCWAAKPISVARPIEVPSATLRGHRGF